MSSRRVAVTGLGVISALGAGREAFHEALKSGSRAQVEHKALADTTVGYIPVRDFSVDEYLESRKTYLDRTTEFLLAAASLALEDADLDLRAQIPVQVAAISGSAYGCLSTMAAYFHDFAAKGPRFLKPILFPHAYANSPLSVLAIEHGIKGFHCHSSSGITASAMAITYGFDLIRSGRARVALVCGCESLNDLVLAMHGDSTVGEGAAVLVLEDLDQALARGALVKSELFGCALAGCGADLGAGMEKALGRAMKSALGEESGATLLFLPSCGPGRFPGSAEKAAIAAISGGNHAKTVILEERLGNPLGASGALQAAAALLLAGEADMTAISLSSDPGGSVAALAFRPLRGSGR